ncbi:MAG: 2-oxo acid dehydrogenase subunit E2 [Clostridia bacterium]|nr:2-oxo acid dehydrogenase subunit E2 [Clostridia bacterium]
MKKRLLKEEHFGIQRKMVAAMTEESWKNIPHVTFIYEPEVSRFFNEYKKINLGRSAEEKITFNTLMIKAITEGIKEAPVMNSHIEYNSALVRGTVKTYENINISMATILPSGEMMTTNCRDFDKKDLDEMTAYIKDLRRRAEKSDLNEALYSVSFNRTLKTIKEGRIIEALFRIIGAKTGKNKVKTLKGKAKKAYFAIPETERLGDKDIEQGTITISNIGSLDLGQRGAVALLEIIPPQVCAIGIGAVQKKPVVKQNSHGKDEVVPGKILPICIAFDHRALDFGDIVPFTKKLDEIFENPEIIHSWTKEQNIHLETIENTSDFTA